MSKKFCLFCDEMVSTTTEGDYYKFIGCSCSPDGFYSLRSDSYEPINSLSHQKKREMLHIISAYIREMTDRNQKVTLSVNDLESIVNSAQIPVTIEDKGNRLLQYLYRHAEGAGNPVVIQPLSSNYNLTYSPNLQELVYIIDKLSKEGLLIREGISFKLTDKGWREAAASIGGEQSKPCLVLISDQEKAGTEWLEKVLPKIEQCGYLPRLLTYTNTPHGEKYSMDLLTDCKLIIADLTGQSPEVYFTAGYALALDIPVIWTVNNSDADNLSVQIQEIRPLVWNSTDELAILLQQRLAG